MQAVAEIIIGPEHVLGVLAHPIRGGSLICRA